MKTHVNDLKYIETIGTEEKAKPKNEVWNDSDCKESSVVIMLLDQQVY